MTATGDADRIALEFLERYWEDRDLGHSKPLSDYLRMFPDFEDRVASEFLRLPTSQVAPAPAPLETENEADGAVGQIGAYKLRTVLGRGGQGTVWLADDVLLGRPVALKLLKQGVQGSAETLTRFIREAKLAARIDHPAVCRVHEAGQTNGLAWIAMQLIEGESLAERIQARRHPSPHALHRTPAVEHIAKTLKMFATLARGLHHAHEQGILHRDIKPANVMVTSNEQPVLLDFGVATSLLDDSIGETATRAGALGTPAYMAPEYITGGREKADRRADVYSLGVTLFETLTLQRPFSADSREAIYHAILTRPLPDPRQFNPRVSRSLRAILDRALHRDPQHRYPSALALAEDLDALRTGHPISAKPPSPLDRLRIWCRRHPARAGLGISLVVLIPLVAALSGFLIASWPSIEQQRLAERDALVHDHLARGIQHSHLGEYELAADSYRQALVLDQAEPEAVAGLALALFDQGRASQALELLSKHRSPRFALLHAELLQANADPRGARRRLEGVEPTEGPVTWSLDGMRSLVQAQRLRATSPSAADAAIETARRKLWKAAFADSESHRIQLFRLARVTALHPQRPDAQLIASVLRANWPEDPMARYWSGVLTDSEAAVQDFQAARKRNPGDAKTCAALGRALVRWNRDPEAVEVYREGLATWPEHASMRFELAMALDRLGHGTEAVAQLERLVADHPHQAWTNLAIAHAYRVAGRLSDTLAAFRAALRADPDLLGARLELAKLLSDAGNTIECGDQLREAVRRHPEEWEALAALGTHLTHYEQDKDEALRLLDLCIERRPGARHLLWTRGDLLAKLGRLDEAVDSYNRSRMFGGLSPAQVGQLTGTHIGRADWDSAIEETLTLLSRNPDSTSGWQQLQIIYQRMKDETRFRGLLDRKLDQLELPASDDLKLRVATWLDGAAG